jgi:hypothetical protein
MSESPEKPEPTTAPIWEPPVELDVPGYTFVRVIARGTRSAVYEVRQEPSGRRFAIKLLPPAVDERAATVFRERGKVLSKITAANVVTSHDTGDGQSRYIVMDLIEGTSLVDKIEDGRIPHEEAVRIVSDIAAGLAAFHGAGLVHGDLKPSSILISRDGKIRIAGFGDAVHGSEREYVAPELEFDPAPDVRSDIFSLGVIAHEVLTGKTLERIPKPPSEVDPNLDPAFDGVVLRAIESSPARRFATAVDFRTALMKAAEAASARAANEAGTRRSLRRRTLSVLGLALIAAGAAAGAYFSSRNTEDFAHARNEAESRALEASKELDEQRSRAERASARRVDVERLAAFLTSELRARLDEAGRPEALEAALGPSEAYFKKLTDPDDPAQIHKLAYLRARAQVHATARRWTEALAVMREYIDLADMLATSMPAERERQIEPVEARIILADYLTKAARANEALMAAQEAKSRISTLRKTLEKLPSSEALFTRACRLIASNLVTLNRAADAAAPLEEALAAWKPIADASPTHPYRQGELAQIITQQARLATAAGNDLKALEYLGAAIECDNRVMNPVTWDNAHRLRLAGNLAAAASARIRLGEQSKAEILFEEVIPLLERLETRAPADSLPVQREVYTAAAAIARAKGELDIAIEHERRAHEAQKLIEELNGVKKEE